MVKSIRERAMDLLARREHSRYELYNKLRQKGFESNEIEAALERLLSDGLLDDARFAESYVRYRAQAGFGPLRICLELRERGIEESVINDLINQPEIDWEKHLRAAWLKKYNQLEPFGSKAYAAQLRFLTQRGFAPETIHKILQHIVSE